MVRKKNGRLTHKERVQIETLLVEKRSKSYIAKTLLRSRSTISREVNKWVCNKTDKYDAELAHWNAKDDYLNKRNLRNVISMNLDKSLLKAWSKPLVSKSTTNRSFFTGHDLSIGTDRSYIKSLFNGVSDFNFIGFFIICLISSNQHSHYIMNVMAQNCKIFFCKRNFTAENN